MLQVAFREKLKKLNPLLFVDSAAVSFAKDGTKTAGLYLKVPCRGKKVDTNYAETKEAREWLDAVDAGLTYKHIGSVPAEEVPEGDRFELTKGHLVARGWRSIALMLVKAKYTTIERARSVFGRGLGESDYDKMSLDQKKIFEDAKPESVQEAMSRLGYK